MTTIRIALSAHAADGTLAAIDGSALSEPRTKLAAELPRPSALPHVLRRAITTAQSGRCGPVLLTLPMDVTLAQIGRPRAGGAPRHTARLSRRSLIRAASHRAA